MIIEPQSNLRHYIDKDIVEKIVNEFTTKEYKIGEWVELQDKRIKYIFLDKSNFQESQFEAHKKHLDIHWVLKGVDQIILGNSENSILSMPYNPDYDYALYHSTIFAQTELSNNSFAVINTNELHTNKIADQNSIKVVIKVYAK
ncbi:MAG: YhcH/YjgK/YiaL family protein [Taibaiella sp.]|jgi:YhcH/YjgK/YiaL family protein